jgi:ABC-type cobalamin transport system ATPase subunit
MQLAADVADVEPDERPSQQLLILDDDHANRHHANPTSSGRGGATA